MEVERDLMFPDWQLPYFVALAPGSPETLRECGKSDSRAAGRLGGRS
jgi:hypothetical protein